MGALHSAVSGLLAVIYPRFLPPVPRNSHGSSVVIVVLKHIHVGHEDLLHSSGLIGYPS